MHCSASTRAPAHDHAATDITATAASLASEPECRICFEGAASGRLSVPCGCAGTSAFAHDACIQTWRMHSVGMRHFDVCSSCTQPYRAHSVQSCGADLASRVAAYAYSPAVYGCIGRLYLVAQVLVLLAVLVFVSCGGSVLYVRPTVLPAMVLLWLACMDNAIIALAVDCARNTNQPQCVSKLVHGWSWYFGTCVFIATLLAVAPVHNYFAYYVPCQFTGMMQFVHIVDRHKSLAHPSYRSAILSYIHVSCVGAILFASSGAWRT
jgi:hypothetical protein